MKQNSKERYDAPTVEAVEITPATSLLQGSPAPDNISAVFAIDDLGVTDTDAASAIWY